MTKEESLIISLREKEMSFNEISNELGLKRDRVRYVCRKYNMGGEIRGGHNKPLEERRYNFARKFEAKFSGFKYHSEFKSVDDNFKSECLSCGFVQERNAQCLRRDGEISCPECDKARRKLKEMINTSQEYLDKKYQSIVTRATMEARQETIKLINWGMNSKEFECLECGKTFKDTRERKYCSIECSRKYLSRVKDLRRRKRLMENGKVDYSVTLSRLIERDKGQCSLCGNEVDEGDFTITDEGHHVAGESYPSIDHILPVSRGGTHTWDNVQLAHGGCNSKKGDGDVYHREGQQQMSLSL